MTEFPALQWPYVPSANQRLDRHLYQMPDQPVFLTMRATLQSAPFTNPDLASAVVGCLVEERIRYKCQVFVYCLLPDHLHVVASPLAGGDVLTYVDRFKGKSTRISWSYGWQRRLWQPRSYDHLIRRDESLQALAQYVLDNPVRKGLVERWQDYPFCALLDPLPGV